MSKELDKLIEEVLAEKISLPFNVPSELDKFINKAKEYTNSTTKSKSNKKFLQALSDLADVSDPPNKLNKADLISALEQQSAADLKKQLAAAGRLPKKFMNELFPLIDQHEKETERYKKLQKSAAELDVMQKIQQMDPEKVKTTSQAAKGFELGTFPSVYQGMTSSEKDYKKVDPNKTVPDAMLFKVFRSIDGETIIEKFTNLQVFASYIMEGKLDDFMKEVLGADPDNPTPEQEFKALNYAMVLTMLGDSSKVGDSSNAGYFFEGFLGYLISAPSVGAAGGASDNIAKIAASKKGLMLSAKFYLNLSQTHQSYDGMIKDLKGSTADGKNNLYYLTITKDVTGASEKYSKNKKSYKVKPTGGEFDTLNLYLTRYWTEGDKIYGVALDENGVDQLGTKDELEISGDNKAKLFTGNLANAAPMLVFPVLPLAGAKPRNLQQAKDYIATQTATQVAEQIGKSSQKKLQAFVDVVSSLKDLEYKSKEYSGDRANRAFATKGGPTASDAVKEIHNSYSGLYGNYQTLFSDVTDREQFTESKSSLDQLIEAIVKKKLLK